MTYYFVYRTTNLINGCIYVGVHQTDDLADGYLGSGTILSRAIRKHGRENFFREILEMFDKSEDAYLLESKIVDQEFISRKDVYNRALGGSGGSILQNRKPFTGRHSEESKQRISEKRRGIKHSESTKHQMSLSSWSKRDPTAQKTHASNAASASHSIDSKRNKADKQAISKKTSESLKQYFKENGSPVSGVKRELVTCPHCGKQGANNTMSRWHFGNCKTMVSMV